LSTGGTAKVLSVSHDVPGDVIALATIGEIHRTSSPSTVEFVHMVWASLWERTRLDVVLAVLAAFVELPWRNWRSRPLVADRTVVDRSAPKIHTISLL
jgi:hypothetical protein